MHTFLHHINVLNDGICRLMQLALMNDFTTSVPWVNPEGLGPPDISKLSKFPTIGAVSLALRLTYNQVSQTKLNLIVTLNEVVTCPCIVSFSIMRLKSM